MEEQPARTGHSEVQSSKICEHSFCIGSKYSEPGLVQIKKNHVTTRVSAKPPPVLDNHRCRARSTSSPSTELHIDESSPSSSSICASTPISGTTILTSERTEDSNRSQPNYMNLTESTKAKQRACNIHRPTLIQRLSSGEVPYHSRKASSNIDSKGSLSSHTLLFSSKLLNVMAQGNEKVIGEGELLI